MSTLVNAIGSVYERIEKMGVSPIWISLVPREQALKRAHEVECCAKETLPLHGLTFAVKDNIDVEGLETTAGCPAFSYKARRTATVVQKLEAAGAILIGKTNMDQFATGLVGVRSPYGVCSSVFNRDYISGGSSSGSAVAVASGLVHFSLGTDTAGSGRVPAAFNNLVGLKPTRGALSNDGVVPACRTLDCVSIFAKNCSDAKAVFDVAQEADRHTAAPWLGNSFSFGVPIESQLEFFGDEAAQELYWQSVASLITLGGKRVDFDLKPFLAAAELLYAGPWVAERLAAIQEFTENHSDEMHPVVRAIILGAAKYSAVDAFNAQYRLDELRRTTQTTWDSVDVLLLPTTPTIYKISDVEADPVRLNSNLGYYTNFVNLLDLSAVAVPAGFMPNGLPFGVSLVAPAFSDTALLYLADRLLGGKLPQPEVGPGCNLVAVVGAHLTGQPLNSQLTSRGARLVRTARTASCYRLYALEGTKPPKPGLVREPGFEGPGIEIEIWAIPTSQYGSFVGMIAAPLGIGSLELSDGTQVQGFLCEAHAVPGAKEITQLGGWRAHLETLPSFRPSLA